MMVLRHFTNADIPALQALLNDSEVTRYLSSKIPQPYGEEDARWWVQEGSVQGVIRAIESDGQLAGCVGVLPGQFEYARTGELGYWLGRQFWRQGITAEAVRQLVAVTFATTDIERIFATVFAPNQPSMALLRKVGFEQEAVLKRAICKNGVFYDSHIFARLK